MLINFIASEGLWQKVNGAGRYLVSTRGEVFSTISNKKLAQRDNGSGYLYVGLSFDDGKQKTASVHRLVLLNFVPVVGSGVLDVNHRSGVKSDNALSNLEWSTRAENIRHAFENGLFDNRGAGNSNSKLTEEQVTEIRKRIEQGESQKALAEHFGVKPNTISDIKLRKRWKHV